MKFLNKLFNKNNAVQADPADIIERIQQNKVWDFPGGVHPPEMKNQSNQAPIKRFDLPSHFYVPVVQHVGSAGQLIVKEGDTVLKGQPLTKGDNYQALPVHAPTSGKIKAIGQHVSTTPSAMPELTVVIEADGEDKWIERSPVSDYSQLTSGEIIENIYQKGVAGLGGAVFPTPTKLNYAIERCKLLIINGAECEPYITCDDRLMQDYTAEMVQGIEVLQHVLQPEKTVIAIEDNKPNAIQSVKNTLKNNHTIELRVIPTKYPSGASDQLVQVLTGLEKPEGKRSIEMGIVMQNVGTALAVKRAVMDDEALIERVVTLTGDRVQNKGNVWARLGTPIGWLLEQARFSESHCFPTFIGGPMMGFTVPNLQVPVTKTVNCILAPDHTEYSDEELERNCIRCSSCSDACPVGLLPQQMYWYSRAKDHEKAKEYNLDACIECGACAFVCPSNIPLIQYFREEKAEIAEIERKEKQAAEAKQRFEAREARLEKEAEARKARIQNSANKRREEVANQKGEDPVQAALARLKAKKADKVEIKSVQPIQENGEPDNRALMAQRKARRLAQQKAKEQKQNQQQAVSSEEKSANNSAEIDPRKAAVAAALARAKAKKETQQQTLQQAVSSEEKSANNSAETDPRKAAVAAALARAKAKKQTQQQAVSSEEKSANNSAEADPRKAAVAAAIARAKAKQAEKQNKNKEEK